MMLSERAATGETGTLPGPASDLPGPDWLRGWVERLAVPRHRLAEARANRRTGALLGASFERLGLRVVEQGRYANVVALPAGSGPVRLVAAHFDSVPGTPGADDNASGVAAMLAVATALSAAGQGRGGTGERVGFIAFNAEEDGLLGSDDFVAHGRDELGVDVALVHVLEMVGFRARGRDSQRSPLPRWVPTPREGDFVGLVGNGASNRAVRDVLRTGEGPRRLGLRTWGPVQRWLPDLGRSDHLPFWRAELPAVLWTDTAEFRNPHYHRPGDRPDTLDYTFLHDVAALLLAQLSPTRRRG